MPHHSSTQLSEFPSGDDNSHQPKYEQLRDYVVAQIESGALKSGAALPSENRLAENLKVARSTVRQALASLEKDGLVLRVHGKGTFVHEEAKQRLRKSQDLFALVLPETETAFYPSLQRSFENAAAELHNQVIVCNSNNDIDKQASAILQLIDLRVAGVAIVPTTKTATPAFHIRQLQKHNIPVVCCSRPVQGVQSPLLSIPFEDIGKLAGEEIRKAGHTHTAFFGSSQSTATDLYLQGFRHALGSDATVDVFVGSGPGIDHESLSQESDAALDRLFQKPEPPTAIFCGFDSLAETVYMQLTQRRIRVPQDVSIVGFGGVFRGGGLSSHLASVAIDEVSLGEQAIEILERMRRGQIPLDSGEHRQISLSFNYGSTLAPCGRPV